MLKSVDICNLFGSYSYKIDFTNVDDSKIKFITAPNGYGKTTVLSLIDAIYNMSLDFIAHINFDSLFFHFDGFEIEISRYFDSTQMPEGDEDISEYVLLQIDFYRGDGSVSSYYYTGKEDPNDETLNDMNLYLNAERCYWIKDNRQYVNDDVLKGSDGLSRISEDAKDFSERLIELKKRFDLRFVLDLPNIRDLMDEQEYDRRKKKVDVIINRLHIFGIYDKANLPEYNVVPPYIAKPLIEFYEKSIADNKQVIDKLNLFYDILVGSDFANKELQISPDFGFRFKANNKDRDIILPDMLSSGEKQIVLMTYEIVFKTIEGMLLLIDEPELSFHTIWQIDFLKNIKAISKLNDSQFIIATHLPQMFGSNWNLTQDLYELNEKK